MQRVYGQDTDFPDLWPSRPPAAFRLYLGPGMTTEVTQWTQRIPGIWDGGVAENTGIEDTARGVCGCKVRSLPMAPDAGQKLGAICS
jgi:hypothetical protein